jgi:hypothetical protein
MDIWQVVNEVGGEIDMTISSGLGKSKRWTGLVVPGIQLIGLDNAIRVGVTKAITLKLPNSWKFTYPLNFAELSEATVNVEAKANIQPQVFKLRNSGQEEFFMGLEIPILSWSIEFTNKESVTVASSLRVNIPERASVRAIILHGVGGYVPHLRSGDVSIPGRKRGNDVRYDLRLLADIRSDIDSSVELTWNYETIQLVTFQKNESKRLKTVDIEALASAVIEKGFFSQDDWDNYRRETAKESAGLRSMLLRQRGAR